MDEKKETAPSCASMRDWLITIRKNKGYTQRYVAEYVGIAQPSYCNIEKGKTRPTVETAKAIANILGFEWADFFEEPEA